MAPSTSEDSTMAVATTSFHGFRPEAMDFLAELAANNERAWFQPRKAEHERLLLEPMRALVGALSERFDARDIPLQADPGRSIFRIYRDTRFSKDKSPYKTNIGPSFPWVERLGGEPDERAHGNGGYLHIAPGDSYVGGGMWMPEKARLDAFRQAVVDDPDRVRAALEDPAMLAAFGPVHPHEMYKRVPPGFPPDHPLAEYLRYKDVVFGRRLADVEIESPTLPDILADAFAAAMPVFRFLATLRA